MKNKIKWKNYLKIWMVAIIVILGIKLFLSFFAPFFGGSARYQVRQDVTFTMKSIFKKHDLSGKLSINEIEHRGFSQGGIVVDYSYSENVNGKPVILRERMDGFDDSGKLYDSASELGFTQFLKKSSLEQLYYSKKTKEIRSELKKQETDNFKLDNRRGTSVYPEMIELVEDDDFLSQKWYKQQVAENRTSADKNRQAFDGYYSICPKQALEKGVAYYRIDFIYRISGEKDDRTDIKGQKLLDNLLSEINFKKFPDAKYIIGFDVQNEEAIMGDISNIKYIQVENGKITAQSSYGEFMEIENWNVNPQFKYSK